MNESHMFEILHNLFSKKELNKLINSLIVDLPDGYELFGEYIISRKPKKYTLTKYYSNLSETFNSLQNAIIYATFHKRNKVYESKRILELDVLLEGSKMEIDLYLKNLKLSKNLETYSIRYNKLNEAKLKRDYLVAEIEKYMLETKSWQEKRFKEAMK